MLFETPKNVRTSRTPGVVIRLTTRPDFHSLNGITCALKKLGTTVSTIAVGRRGCGALFSLQPFFFLWLGG